MNVMLYVSDIYTTAPESFKTPVQRRTYQALKKLGIPYERVETDEAITMEDCVAIDEKLKMKMVKTLFLTNKQQAAFYVFVTTGEKHFDSSAFCAALDVPRVSFAPAVLMEEVLGVKVGAATVFGVLLDAAGEVRVVIDRDVANEEYYGCSDGTTTGYMKIRTSDIIDRFLPYADHPATIIDMPQAE